tara:strand:+ start:939 stop:1286 length:348 start_codon:yes stop_codon:yes gene_type:complete
MKNLMNTLVNKSITQTKLRLKIKVCEHAIEIKKLSGTKSPKVMPAEYGYNTLDQMYHKLDKLKTDLKIAEQEDAMNEHMFHVMLLEGHEKAIELQEKLDRAKELEKELKAKFISD